MASPAKLCPICGVRYDPAATFCQKDGARLTSEGEADPYLGKMLLGQFRIEEPIGAGGMGTVYRARQTSLNRDVAIKILHPELARGSRIGHQAEGGGQEDRAAGAAQGIGAVEVRFLDAFAVDPHRHRAQLARGPLGHVRAELQYDLGPGLGAPEDRAQGDDRREDSRAHRVLPSAVVTVPSWVGRGSSRRGLAAK